LGLVNEEALCYLLNLSIHPVSSPYKKASH
jgi:hypothetical protein